MRIYYKDWGEGQPIVLSHGWPLSADNWDLGGFAGFVAVHDVGDIFRTQEALEAGS